MEISSVKKRRKSSHRQTIFSFYSFRCTSKCFFLIGSFAFFLIFGVQVIPSQVQGIFHSSSAFADTSDQNTVTSQDERCYWQEDVAKFFALQQGKENALKITLPCETFVLETKKEKSHFSDNVLEKTLREITGGYPIEAMVPTIATFDREVAGLIVGIAKKESNWGKRVPVDKEGKDCFNYWGYKGAGTRGVEMGHGCFGSPEEAVMAVGNRLRHLVEIRNTSDPKNMIVWKCGSSCAGHSDESVRKWIADVSLYYDRIASSEQ